MNFFVRQDPRSKMGSAYNLKQDMQVPNYCTIIICIDFCVIPTSFVEVSTNYLFTTKSQEALYVKIHERSYGILRRKRLNRHPIIADVENLTFYHNKLEKLQSFWIFLVYF